LRLELTSIETIRGTMTLFATFAPDQRDPALAATNAEGPGIGYDALLGPPPAARAPAELPSSAIGGGPREEEESMTEGPPPSGGLSPRAAQLLGSGQPVEPWRFPPIQLPRGTRLNLMLTRPLGKAP
jgi:hypothetical protein